jgi:hypothetical protein
VRARELALAELHAATLQLGAVQVALGAQAGDAASPAMGPRSPSMLATDDPKASSSAEEELRKAREEAEELRGQLTMERANASAAAAVDLCV